jgi:hypothetical protein
MVGPSIRVTCIFSIQRRHNLHPRARIHLECVSLHSTRIGPLWSHMGVARPPKVAHSFVFCNIAPAIKYTARTVEPSYLYKLSSCFAWFLSFVTLCWRFWQFKIMTKWPSTEARNSFSNPIPSAHATLVPSWWCTAGATSDIGKRISERTLFGFGH